VAYATVDFCKLGVPQRRKRLIAGSPALVARLVRATTVGDVDEHPMHGS
jgi:hypothetical protein